MQKARYMFKKQNQHNRKAMNVTKDQDCDDDYSVDRISCEDNHIYFYDDVNTKNILALIKFIRSINNKLLLLKMELELKHSILSDFKIFLHINSYGGYITDALSGVDAIKNSKIPITTIIEGAAASAATLLSVVGAERQITKNSSMLIHQLSGCSSGTYEQMKDELINSTYLEDTCNKIYLEHTKKKLKKKVLNETLKHDLWWGAEKCLQHGLVDEII